MASAAAVAQATDRTLVVVWRTDHHCEARISDLLRYDGPVIESDEADRIRAACGLDYNYMEIEPGSQFEAPILAGADASSREDVYVRSAYPLNSPHRVYDVEQAFLRSLRPSDAVLDMIAGFRPPFDVAVHIRMAGGPAFEHMPFESSDNWPEHRHRELTAWREKSHRDNFVRRLDALVAQGGADSIFLAADMPETYAALSARYGARLIWLERDLYDRSPRQLQYALADLLMLSAGRRLLGSAWSSFSDVAQRLAREDRPFEQSGVDF
ncbi:MAG: hypothetical protein HLUCCA12_14770 [Rhodobacteraceae bacterium HLUCCA12]|nr:MAG: hypothetical protein HLUCCA12_14770 [Rhodobacteraceae bacterium HLUCCA12]